MARSFGLVDDKVKETDFFIFQMNEKKENFFAVQCNAVAFTASARSITFAMQSSLKGVSHFDSWYKTKQQELKRNELAKFFHEFRRVSQHIGVNVVRRGSVDSRGYLSHFIPHPELKVVPKTDVITSCETYFKLLLELVYECYIEFDTEINAHWYYTSEHFETLGLSIEDAEAKLGYPRGHTDIGKPSEDFLPWRWELLRRYIDGCTIQDQFSHWLGKTVPIPERLPEYEGEFRVKS